MDQGKRSFISLGMGFLGVLFGEAAKETYRVKVVDRVLELVDRPIWSRMPQNIIDRASLVYELFLSSEAQTEFIPPTNWGHKIPNVALPGGGRTYGHEAAVLKSIANFVCSSLPLVTWDINESSWLAHRDFSQVMLASGSSNLATRAVIGEPEKPMFISNLNGVAVKLAYSIGMGTGELKRHQYHEEIKRRALAICKADGSPALQAEGSGGWQRDDYLLVTRVPGPAPNSVYTVLSGLHGPGTRSAELLFTALSSQNLQRLASYIGHEHGHNPYFQAVFRASNFKIFDGSDVATHMELVISEKCPPVPIKCAN